MKIDLAKPLTDKTNTEARQNVVGRYSVTKLLDITTGKMTPEEYIKGETFDFVSCFRMREGTIKHNSVEEVLEYLGYKTEVKKEMDCGEFVIVGVADILTDNSVGEIKTRNENINKTNRWNEYQAKFYCTLFDRLNCILFQPRVSTKEKMYGGQEITGWWLEKFGEQKRNDAWVKKQIELVAKFDKQLKEYVKKRT